MTSALTQAAAALVARNWQATLDVLGEPVAPPAQIMVDADVTLGANSNSRVPTQAAIRAYVASLVAGTSLVLGTTAGTAAAGNDSRITGAMQRSYNLADLPNMAIARNNLGLGALATLSALDASVIPVSNLTTSVFATGVVDTDANLTAASTTRVAAQSAVKAYVDALASSVSANYARKGANNDITTITGLTTALSLSQGGTGATTAPAARTALGLGTLAILSAIDASSVTVSNLTTAAFATNVVDTDATLAANSATRVAAQSAVKSYIDNAVTGLTWKPAAILATTANITLSGEQTIDGVLTSGTRVLVKNQTVASQNGVYVTSSGAWSRALDLDAGAEFPGATVMVERGTVNAATQWTCSNASVTLGSTSVTFVQISGAGTYSAGSGLSLSGNQFAIAAGGVTAAMLAAVTGSGNVVLSGSPVLTTPNLGTPSAVVLTSATGLPWSSGITGKPTTLAGYGISDGITAALAASTYAALASSPTFTGTATANGFASPNFSVNSTGTSMVLAGSFAGFEIGAMGATNSPYIDFHSGATATDYDVRIQASGGTGTTAGGTLTLYSTTLNIVGTPQIGGIALSSLYPLLSSGPAFAGDIYSSGTNAGGVRNIQVQNASTTIGTQARLTLSTGTPNAYALWYVNQDSTSVASLNLGVGAGISGVNITPMVNFGTSPIAPTPANTDVSTKVATTAFVSSVLADYSNNAKYAGVLPNGSDMTALNAAYFSAGIAKGMPLFYPPGTYEFSSPVAFDMTASVKKGIKIEGAGIGQTIFHSSVTATGGNPLFYFYSGADWYDLSVSDICFTGAINDVLGAVGKNDFSDPLNVANFTNVAWLNSYPGSNNVALRMNYVVNSIFNNCRANSYATGQRTLTSSTSNSVGTGAKSFTIAAGQSVAAPGIVSLKSAGSPSNTMTGTITSYNSTTGALVLNITSVTGSGTFSDWSIYFAGLNYGGALQLRQTEFTVFNGGSYSNAARAIQVKDGFNFTIVFNAVDIENMDYGVSVSTTSGGLLTFVGGQFSLWEQAGVSVTGSLSPNAVTIINPNLSNPNNAQPFIDQANYAGIRLIDGTSISTPSLPTTGSTWTNKSGKKVLVTWWGGTVTSAVVSGQTIAAPAGSVVVPHGQGFILNFTGSPNWFHQALE